MQTLWALLNSFLELDANVRANQCASQPRSHDLSRAQEASDGCASAKPSFHTWLLGYHWLFL